ncbi:1518_t:CDS:2 [Ambispora gerdemannii]|uniref:1518_t:CDS:1 n=1 Tax=Ambispora gerdemannii TaxID=144530 RepID=A0A9N9DJG2_9GLOM|nr:1518_t:CDS:2 [Ambispora gerdemannii]
MLTRLNQDTLFQIFTKIQDEKSLFSCLLVCREFCRCVVPILWRTPLDGIPSARLFQTYLSCLPKESLHYLRNNGISIDLSIPQAFFDYISFARYIDTLNLEISALKWCSPTVSDGIDAFRIWKLWNMHSDEQQQKALLMVHELYKCFLDFNRCKNLHSLKVEIGSTGIKRVQEPPLFKVNFDFPSVNYDDNALTHLRRVILRGNFDKTSVIQRLAMESRDIEYLALDSLEMDVPEREAVESIKLIQMQINLIHLRISHHHSSFTSIMGALVSQKHSLASLELHWANFGTFSDTAIEGLVECVNLKALTLKGCHSGDSQLSLKLSTAFSRLQSLHFAESNTNLGTDFIASCIATAGKNLRYLKLDKSMNFQGTARTTIAQKLSQFCPNLEFLEIAELDNNDVASILCSCKKLVDFIFTRLDPFDDRAFLELGPKLSPGLQYIKVDRVLRDQSLDYFLFTSFLNTVGPNFKCFDWVHDRQTKLYPRDIHLMPKSINQGMVGEMFEKNKEKSIDEIVESEFFGFLSLYPTNRSHGMNMISPNDFT